MSSLLAVGTAQAKSAAVTLAAAAKVALVLIPPQASAVQPFGGNIPPDAAAKVQVQASNGEYVTIAELNANSPRVLIEGPCVYRVARLGGNIGIDLGDATAWGASANTVAPAITGGPNYPGTLSVSNGTNTTVGTVNFTYQWKRGGVNIPGATASTYDLTRTDVDAAITCSVTMTDSNGSITTAATGGVTPVMVAVNSVLPAVTPTTATTGTVLSTTQGTWDASSATVYTRQWKKNGTNIGAATGVSYTVLAGDLGATITCTVTATTSAGAASATSNGVVPA